MTRQRKAENVPLAPEAERLLGVRRRREAATLLTAGLAEEELSAYTDWMAAFYADLAKHPHPTVTHAAMAAKWGVGEATVRWWRGRILNGMPPPWRAPKRLREGR